LNKFLDDNKVPYDQFDNAQKRNINENSLSLGVIGSNPSVNGLSLNYEVGNDDNMIGSQSQDSTAKRDIKNILPLNEMSHFDNNGPKHVKLHNSSINVVKENTYLKYLLIAAETILDRGLKFLEDSPTIDNCSSSLGINSDFSRLKHKSEENLNLKLQSSENNLSISSNSHDNNFVNCSNKNINLDTTEPTRKCYNKVCGVVESKNHGWFKVKISKSRYSWLCRGCFKAWKNNQFCYYCNVIYRDNASTTNYIDNKSWIQCDFCEMWQHIQCEEAKGFYTNISGLITDTNFKYICPLCRCKNENLSLDNPSNPTKDKRKTKRRNNKLLSESNHDFLVIKPKPDKEIESNQGKIIINIQ